MSGETPVIPPTLPADFEFLARAGSGGMGTVYKARQISLDRVVALKMVLGGAHAGGEDLLRLCREADAVAKLRHPNIVQVYEVGHIDGLPWFAMEFVDGGTLAGRIGGVPQPPRQAAEIVRALASAMHHAHVNGVVHRDLKPANVLITPDGLPKIVDFGLAKRTAQQSVTATGAVLGTPSYMAPEQAMGKSRIRETEAGVDVYGLGAILYEMLTGRPPFLGESHIETMRQVVNQDPVPPRQFQPRVPRDLETICLKCLEKAPAKRYASADELAADLGRFLADEPIKARRAGRIERLLRWTHRNPAKAITAGAVVTVLLVAAFWYRSEELRQFELRQAESERIQGRKAVLSRAKAVALAQTRAGEFAGARDTLAAALADVPDEPELTAARAELRPLLTRSSQLETFYRRADEAWFTWGEERLDESLAACNDALGAVGAAGSDANADGWWTRLPADELDTPQREALRLEAYRVHILASLLRLGMIMRDRTGPPRPDGKAEDGRRVADAVASLLPVLAAEKAGAVPPSRTTTLVLGWCWAMSMLVGGGEAIPRPLPAPPREESPADPFFSGTVQFFVANFKGDAMQTFISTFSRGQLDVANPLETAEARFRAAVAAEPTRYWPCFLLGWTLAARGKYDQAELAFDACVALRPKYARGYDQRALALIRRALDAKDAKARAELVRRADGDFARSLDLSPNDPSGYWPLAEGHALLGRRAEALRAYARALELDERITEKVSRRAGIAAARAFAEAVLTHDPLDAGAHALMFWIRFRLREYDAAAESAAAALSAPGRRALALAGRPG